MALLLTKKYTIALGVVGAIAITGLGINYVIMPTLDNVGTSQQAVVDAQGEVDVMNARLASLQASQSQFDAIQTIDQELSQQFPAEGGVQTLLDLILAGAAANGIPAQNVSAITFSPPVLVVPAVPVEETAPVEEATATEDAAPVEEPVDTEPAEATNTFGDGFAKIDLTLSLKGTPEQITGFLNYLNTMNRVVIVSQTTMGADGDTGDYLLSLTGKAYLFRPIAVPTTTETAPVEDEVVVDENATSDQ